MLLLDGDISRDLTPCLKIDDTVYNASISDDILQRLGGRLQCLSPRRRRRWRANSHRAGQKWQTLISAAVSLPFLLFPQWTSAHVDPHPPWKKQNGDPWNEMPNAALLATRRERGREKKNKNNKKYNCDRQRTEKVKERKGETIGRNNKCSSSVGSWWAY